MTKTPGESPGSSSSWPASPGEPAGSATQPDLADTAAPLSEPFPYTRPGLALGIAAVGYLVTVALTWPGWRPVFGALPLWAGTLSDAVVTLGPLLAAALVAGRLAGPRVGRALGLRVRPVDLLIGALGALVARALVEVVAPTTGSLRPALGSGVDATAAIVAAVVALVVLAPLVEEMFFRGVLQRALTQVLDGVVPSGGSSRPAAATVAIAVTTAAFVTLHAVPYGAAVPLGVVLSPLVVGIGAGAATVVTGRIGAGVVLHVLFNLTGVVLLLR